jgi:hypothetical protein
MKIKEPFGVKMIKLILAVLFIVFLIVVGPLLTIWALNTLFPVLAIDYTWQTWLAVVIIGGLFKSSVSIKK